MKKFTKKMKGKKVLSLVLAAIMLATTFNIALPMLKLDAGAAELTRDSEGNIIIDGVTQKQIVKDTSVYDTYATTYLNGSSTPTGIIVPGLDPAQDYVIQGMTYYPERDWMLVTAYHNYDSEKDAEQFSSKVFALDAATGEFVAMFSFKNLDDSANVDHGGGIAVSEHNIYYSCGDKDRKIAYAPLSFLKNAEPGTHTVIPLVDEIVLHELGNAYTAYVCYDEGVLWAGNFYDKGTKIAGIIDVAADYNGLANAQYNSMVFGYKLAGNSSEEEWDYLKGKFQNLLTLGTPSGSSTSNGSTFSWKAYKNAGVFNISGTITAPTAAVGEFTHNGVATFTLTEGVDYTVEFTSNNKATDLYMWSPAGTHCNVKQSTQTTITPLGNGRYHYKMNFTAGLKPNGADSSWPTTQSTDSTYTGKYTLRFDQDAIQAGESREFEITNIKISQTNTYENSQEKVYDEGSAGSPTYALGLNNALKDVQYAVVDNGKLYLSRSYGSGAGNSVSFGFGDSSWLSVADIDLSVPGNVDVTLNINGTQKQIKAYDISQYTDYPMMPMSEGLCVVDDNIFITFEGASNKYLNESSGLTSIGNCTKPVDVVWKLDPYALMELEIPEPENSIYYEKVSSLNEIKDGEEYIIIHQSSEKDPVTQKNILYAINADGGLKGHKLSKCDIYAGKGYNAMVGHPITEYAIVRAGDKDSFGNVADKDRIYLDNTEKDDVDSVRWTLNKKGEKRYLIKTTESYFANCNSLYFDQSKIGMAPSNATYLDNMAIQESGNGNGGFWLSNAESYYLWCNDGLSENYNKKITSFYIENGVTTAAYSGIDELDGTFHCDALNTTNIMGQKIQDDSDRVFYIYKRVKDDISSTYESRVFTDLNAELQADGTYTIDFETYAISPNHYQYVEERPTDYIIVADTSSSMATDGSAGLISYPGGTLSVKSFIANKEIVNDSTQNAVNGYAFSKPEEELYFKHTDGGYYHLKLAIHTYDLKGMTGKNDQRYWAYYVTNDGMHYILQNNGSVLGGFTYAEFISKVDNGVDYTKQSNTKSWTGDYTAQKRYEIGMVNCDHYRFADDAGEFDRFSTMKATVERVSDQIISQNPQNRIACVKYGADAQTAYFSKGTGTWATSVPTSNVNAFYDATELSGAVVASILESTSAQTSNEGIELKIASEIVKYSGVDYTDKGERNLAVIFVSDGIPGQDGANAATAKNAADKVISYASEIKKAGGFIYTIVMGQDSSFDRNTYMQAVSTTYAEATSMENLGGRSVDGINYNLNLSSCNLDYFIDIGSIAMKETIQNAAVGLSNLDDSAVIRQELSESFKFDKASYKAELIEGNFDAIGRFSFDEKNTIDAETENVEVTPVDGIRHLTITGYNYAKEYIGNGKSGRKLRIRITDVLADENAVIQNTSIANIDTAAIYKSVDDMNYSTVENDLSFKKLPTEYFNIPKYTYVLDYGLQLLDTDVNGTLKSVSADLSAQRDAAGNIAYKEVSENKLIAIDTESRNQNLLYHNTPTNATDSGYVLIQRPEGNYDWFEIEVVPASNVYFEEEDINVKEADKDNTKKLAWITDGKATTSHRGLPGEDDVDGFENAYNVENQTYSNGTAMKVVVDSANKNSKNQTFDFVGTGIDIVSRCDYNTGMMLITIKNKTTGARVKSALVDTYCAESAFNQTPVFSWSGDYGTYTVEIGAMYLTSAGALKANSTTKNFKKSNIIDTGLEMNASDSFDTDVLQAMLDEAEVEDVSAKDVELVWFDDNSIFNGGTGVAPTKKGSRADGGAVVELENYIDGFRVYNPLGKDAEAYEDYKDSEKNVSYVNVAENLSEICSDGSTFGEIAYITGGLAEGETLDFEKYQNIGPTGELYLNAGKSVAFKINRAAGERVMLGLRAVNGVTDVTVNNIKVEAENGIKSSTEMYYDITDCGIGTGTGVSFTVTNSGTGLLAVNHIKFSGGASPNTTPTVNGVRSIARSNDASAVETSKFLPITQEDLVAIESTMKAETIPAMVKNGVVVPIVEEEEEIPGDTTNPGDDNINDDTNNDNGNTDTDNETDDSFDIFSIIKALITFIREILFNSVGNKSLL